ncbi:MAG: hypothetical protein ACYS47_05765 [Planctomycetota bacterium]|jgi:hypothetical protein
MSENWKLNSSASRPTRGIGWLVRFWGIVALGLLLTVCGKKEPPPSPAPVHEPAPASKPGPEPAPPPPKNLPDPPEGWTPTPEAIAAAPEVLHRLVDEYSTRFLPGPSRAMLKKKMAVFEGAVHFFKGSEAEKKAARLELANLGLATARFLMELPPFLVPKAERPPPDPDDFESFETPEDKALEVIKDIMEARIRDGDVDALIQFLASATGKEIDLDNKLVGKKRELRPRRVHPIPALWSLGRDLGCDMETIDPEASRVALAIPVLLDLKIRGEDVAWLLESIALQGRFKAVLDPGVEGPVDFRVRCDSYRDAFRAIAAKAGFTVEEIEGGYRVQKQ